VTVRPSVQRRWRTTEGPADQVRILDLADQRVVGEDAQLVAVRQEPDPVAGVRTFADPFGGRPVDQSLGGRVDVDELADAVRAIAGELERVASIIGIAADAQGQAEASRALHAAMSAVTSAYTLPAVTLVVLQVR